MGLEKYIVKAVAVGFNGSSRIIYSIQASSEEEAIKAAGQMTYFRVGFKGKEGEDYINALEATPLESQHTRIDLESECELDNIKRLLSRLTDDQRTEVFNSYDP